MIRHRISNNATLFIIGTLFAVWAVAFIWHSSFMAMDGQRYFSLADDAMISMRYARNLSQGVGLVWNAGERVEGYSNLLMVLVMSLATGVLHRSAAVLAVQLGGIPIVVGTAYLTRNIFRFISKDMEPSLRAASEAVVFLLVCVYYPLVFWTLMGMETGLLTFLLCLAILGSMLYVERGGPWLAGATGIALGLAFLARNDAGIYAVLVLAYMASHRKGSRRDLVSWCCGLLPWVGFVAGQGLFRWHYYGAWVPNTYVLKVVGMPMLDRLENGFGYIAPFMVETGILLLIAGYEWVLGRRRQETYLGLLALTTVLYQISVGGDVWARWRMLAPMMPLVIVAFVAGCARLFRHEFARSHPRIAATIVSALVLAGVLSANLRWLPEIALQIQPGQDTSTVSHIDTAIAINAVTRETASLGVFFAGVVPYYSSRRAIDFLGRSDAHIASLPPDTSGDVSWAGMRSVPGHNKYDLEYSLAQLQPTWVESMGFRWGSQDLSEWSKTRYVTVRYGSVRLHLLRGSPDVYWDRVRYLDPLDEAEAEAWLP